MKFETKFKIGQKPWSIKFDKDEHRYIVFQNEEPITQIHIVIMENGEAEIPCYGFDSVTGYGKEYKDGAYLTREEAVAEALELYKADIDQLKADISYIEWKMEELEK